MQADHPLAKKKCIPCTKQTPPLKGEELDQLHKQLAPHWNIVKEHHLQKTFLFSNFREALDFVNKVGQIAEEQGHHPDMHLSYGKVKIELWTHKIDGLSESDFILAAKCDSL